MSDALSTEVLAALKKEIKAAISILDKKQIDPQYTLLNRTGLAAALHVDRLFVTAMGRWGDTPFTFDLGGRTTLNKAHAWLEANPTFPGINRQPKAGTTVTFNHRKTRPRVKQAASL